MDATKTTILAQAIKAAGITLNGVVPVGTQLMISVTVANKLHTLGITESEIDNSAAVIAKIKALAPAPKAKPTPAPAPAPKVEAPAAPEAK